MQLETLITEFIADGKYRKLSPRTLKMYAFELKHFLAFCHEHYAREVLQVDSGLLKLYALHLQDNGNNSGGIAFKFRVIRALCGYLNREEIPNAQPFKRFKMPRIEQQVMKYVELSEYETLMAVARESNKPLRDSAIISLLYDTGIRVGELMNLKLEDVLSDRGMLKVSGKTGERLVPVSRHVLKRMNQYVNQERPKSVLREVFLTNKDTCMNYYTVSLMLQRIFQRAKLPYKSPHCFRRGFATRLILNGADVFSLQRILGHTTLTMSNRYAVLNNEALKQVHLIASPTRRN